MINDYLQGEFYHVFNRSIARFNIFGNKDNSQRFVEVLDYYNINDDIEFKAKYSVAKEKQQYIYNNLIIPKDNSNLKFISYCIIPDHYHLLIKILKDNKLSKYINDIENSYTRYFNIRFNRKGPLWESSFKAVRVENNEQLLHVSRYLHLNPTTAGLVERPEDWKYSSYKDLITNDKFLKEYLHEISISDANSYKRFVENNIDYQKKLGFIKKLIFK